MATVTSKTTAASVSVSAKSSGTVVPFTGGAERREVGFGVVAALAGVVAFAF